MPHHHAIKYHLEREFLFFYSFHSERMVSILREEFGITKPIDLDKVLSDPTIFNVPLFPDTLLSNAIDFKRSEKVRILAKKLDINFENLKKFVFLGERPKFDSDQLLEGYFNKRIFPIVTSEQLYRGVYLQLDDGMTQEDFAMLLRMAKKYSSILSKRKRQQGTSEERRGAYLGINIWMMKLYEDGQNSREQETTLFNAALECYSNDFMEKNNLSSDDDELFPIVKEKLRQDFLAVIKSYELPSKEKLAELLLDIVHK